MPEEEKKPHVGYYAIIPASVRYSRKLCANAKLLYGEITALASREGFCWSTNKYFADLYGVTSTSVSKWVSQLVKAGFVRVEIISEFQRKIYLNEGLGVLTKVKGGINKRERGVLTKGKDNKTLNNTINIAEASPSAFSLKEEIEKMENDSRRDLNLIGFYAQERLSTLSGKIKNKAQLSAFIRRHLQAAGKLKVYNDDQVVKATDAVRQKYRDIDWTLETVLKELTK